MTLENGNLESLEARFLVGLDCSGRTWSLQVVTHTVVLWPVCFFGGNKVQVLNEEILGTWCSKHSFVEKRCRRRLSYDLSSKASPPCGHSISGCRSLRLKTFEVPEWCKQRISLRGHPTYPKKTRYIHKPSTSCDLITKSFKGSDCHAKNMRCLL